MTRCAVCGALGLEGQVVCNTAWMSREICTVSPTTTPPPSSSESVSMPKSISTCDAAHSTVTGRSAGR
jgi:hypothetical protein